MNIRKPLLLVSLGITNYLLGGSMTELSEIAKALPAQAVELTFDLPFRNHPPQGELHVYSAPLEKGVFILSSLQLPTIKEEILSNEKSFIQNFATYLASHLFYDPSVFKQNQMVNLTPMSISGQPAVNFHISYQDKGNSKVINGIAVYKDHTLYHLFYITSESDTEKMKGYYEKAAQQLATLI
jgi:hypothetical protein